MVSREGFSIYPKSTGGGRGGEKVKMYSMSTYSRQYDMDIEITLMGVEKNSSFFDCVPSAKAEEAVITGPMAKKLKLLGADAEDFNCLVSDEKLTIDEAYLAKYLTRSDIIGATGQLMDMFDTVLKVFSISSVVIYMILMYILTKTVIEKNALYISFMKVFGYNSKEAGSLYLHATGITVILSVLVCLPLQHLGFGTLMDSITGMIEGYVPFYLPAWVYVFIAVVGIGAYFVINSFHVRKVQRIPMSDALKNRE